MLGSRTKQWTFRLSFHQRAEVPEEVFTLRFWMRSRTKQWDDDEQSFHQGPGAVADPNIVRWQVKMKIVMTLTLRVTGDDDVDVDVEE